MSQHTPKGFAAHVRRVPLLLALVAILGAILAPAIAFAATAPPFDPTLVISDEVFRGSGSMSQADVQAFLDATTGALDTLTFTRHDDPDPVNGVKYPASQLIWEAAQAFNINPKVILTKLQVEQGLLSNPSPSQQALDQAMGCGIYTGSTNNYLSFGNQVWYGASKLDGYVENTWTPGMTRQVCTMCKWDAPSKTWLIPPVYDPIFAPKNKATFKLYVYTPHSHNSTVGGGNYLFWVVYWRYFSEGPIANPALLPVYRFYNKMNGSHFYTASETERLAVVRQWSDTYTFEGPAYSINTSNTANSVPLYRFYNTRNGSHFYTASAEERDAVIAKWSSVFRYEGPVYNVSMTPEGGTPMYRFYNRRIGSHFYTISPDERDAVIATWPDVYTFEGVAFYIGK